MSKRNRLCSLKVIRYADDFVVLHSDKQIILKCRELISTWLNDIGLELKPSKTRLAHTLLPKESEDGIAGFNFLGFNIIQRPAGKYVSANNPQGKILGFNTTPVKVSVCTKKSELGRSRSMAL